MDRTVLGSDPSKLKSRMEYLERAKAYGETRGIGETGTNEHHVNGAGNGPGILKSPLVKRRSIGDGTKQFVDMPKRVHFAKTVSPKSVPLQTQDATEAVNPDCTQTTTSSGSGSGKHLTDIQTSRNGQSVTLAGHKDSSTGTCAASSDLQSDDPCSNNISKVSTEFPESRSRESTVRRPNTPFWRTNPFDKLDDTIKRQTVTNLLCESSDLLQKYDGHSSGCGKTSRSTQGKDYKVPLSDSVAVVTAPENHTANSVAMVTTPKIQTRNSVAMATPSRSVTKGSVTIATIPNIRCFDSAAMTTAPKIRTEHSATMVTKPRIQTGTAQYRSRSVSPSPRCTGVTYRQNKVLYHYTVK